MTKGLWNQDSLTTLLFCLDHEEMDPPSVAYHIKREYGINVSAEDVKKVATRLHCKCYVYDPETDSLKRGRKNYKTKGGCISDGEEK